MYTTPRTFAIILLMPLLFCCVRSSDVDATTGRRLLLIHRPAPPNTPTAPKTGVKEWVARPLDRPRPLPLPETRPSLPPIVLTSLMDTPEFSRVDSLIQRLDAQLKDSSQQARTRSRQRRKLAVKPFVLGPQNIRPTDTVFVDTLGVKLAFWITGNGTKMKVLSGDVKRTANEIEVQPPATMSAVQIGIVAALLMGSLIAVIVFARHYARTTKKDASHNPGV